MVQKVDGLTLVGALVIDAFRQFQRNEILCCVKDRGNGKEKLPTGEPSIAFW